MEITFSSSLSADCRSAGTLSRDLADGERSTALSLIRSIASDTPKIRQLWTGHPANRLPSQSFRALIRSRPLDIRGIPPVAWYSFLSSHLIRPGDRARVSAQSKDGGFDLSSLRLFHPRSGALGELVLQLMKLFSRSQRP